ncbi:MULTISPECIES: phage holin family protein [Kocuria]|jgi:putative membrane protein|uniref:phage holin family protein n=1 Tax=Kocuria TaxID=57493 RepID=UPI000367112A|nr:MULTISPECIES: phage holin family protein [Kocuria]MCC5782078.1 phage holin family protein [Kocuria sp. CCUG 69068]EYT55328.1 membrane protein [Kocuria sp. UCD-OTCP]MCM3485901.1 phage holin family protein [Kocuria rosea]MEB2528099.1 phage holin family protein [Kocuria rosea]MEB2617657.1 phage holin family protein [Kocuria rosea]
MSFLLRVLVNALAIWVAAWILPGMGIAADPSVVSAVGGETTASVLAYLFVGLVFGAVNAVVRPVLTILSLPITCLTLGLFAIVVNAAMLWLTSWLSSFTPLRLEIDSFLWTAVLATLIIGVVSLLMGWAVPDRERR